ncbi:hypothetical protein THMIRHAM_12750 [Thiomicrorhabdus immobilis]|uniref:DNA alkylation repair protein n=1 Tax=Thiomicrorhabdus immobilis TaxID=2791037 RepID=A0ABM7MDT0_9GAMM|nr:DNA alkylation repair protein [Thiomicrorhabdus immobilis]BCN93490.1 hypothetical protein THMIRHAM_12750 [Thiomicrorhabdus immobilis]
MAELLKNEIDVVKIKKLTGLVKQLKPEFDANEFENAILDGSWPELGLKQRVRKLSKQLNRSLNSSYRESLSLLQMVSVEFSGLFHFIFADFVELYGLDEFEASMQALALFTQNSTAEYAIRVFINQYPEQSKQQLLIWSKSDDAHLRRLASEGVRPRLPWATHLPWIAKNPDWVRPILENLKSDSSRYVQKSVANLINDLSKTQREWVLDLAETWMLNACTETQWIIKHGLRTLLKQGDSRALMLMGYGDVSHLRLSDWQLDTKVAIGEKLHGQFNLTSNKPMGLLRLEYALWFLRKSQVPYRKVFKLAESDYQTEYRTFHLQHNFKPISTRNYLPGLHKIELIINGQTLQTAEFTLTTMSDTQNT